VQNIFKQTTNKPQRKKDGRKNERKDQQASILQCREAEQSKQAKQESI